MIFKELVEIRNYLIHAYFVDFLVFTLVNQCFAFGKSFSLAHDKCCHSKHELHITLASFVSASRVHVSHMYIGFLLFSP